MIRPQTQWSEQRAGLAAPNPAPNGLEFLGQAVPRLLRGHGFRLGNLWLLLNLSNGLFRNPELAACCV